MFFQISPPSKITAEPVPTSNNSEDIAVLSLGPFTQNPKLCFENVQIGVSELRCVIIKNPDCHPVEVLITKSSPPERHVTLSWHQHHIPSNGEATLEIIWSPIQEGSWRDIFTFENGRQIKKDVPIVFKSLAIKNTLADKPVKKGAIPKKGKISSKNISPVYKIQKKYISPKKRTNTVLFKKTLQPKTVISSCTYSTQPTKFHKNNKENYDPHQEYSETFQSPSSPLFNDKLPKANIRRETYNVNNGIKNVQNNTYIKSAIMPDSSKHNKFAEKNEFSINVRTSTENASCLNQDIASRLQLITFQFSPIETTKSNIFNPLICSTSQKPRYSSNDQASQQATNNVSFNVDNIKTERLSSDNKLLEDLHMKTYIQGGDLTSTTNIEYEIDSLKNIPLTPLSANSSKFMGRRLSPYYNEIVKQENVSPNLKLHHVSLSGVNAKNVIGADLWCSDGETPLHSIKKEKCSETRKRRSGENLEICPSKKINLTTTSDSIFEDSLRSTCKPLPLKKTHTKQYDYKISQNITGIPKNLFCPIFSLNLEEVDEQERRFVRWLNTLLIPYPETDGVSKDQPDVIKLWQQSKCNEIENVPSKQMLSINHHKENNLTLLRKTAQALFKTEIRFVIDEIKNLINSGKLYIRPGKNVHQDFYLQNVILSLLLSYNPLWLRIGLETVFSEELTLHSNGLTNFINQRIFRHPKLLQKYKSVQSPKYEEAIKKHILEKILSLIYFLDNAKIKKLIAYDPCLFCKNSCFKESREILLHFSKEVLPAAFGDIIKYLRVTGYLLCYKQTYIHEFNYAVVDLYQDLRDGIRLTRVMELLTLQNNLTMQLRTPAISRLQKVHNVTVVFDTLKKFGFGVIGDISPGDIVNCHKDKTLFLLWQIIFKFESPLIIQAAIKIQRWWKSLFISMKRRVLSKNRQRVIENEAAITIQKYFCSTKLMRNERMNFLILRRTVLFVQKKFRANRLMKQQQRMYQALKTSTKVIQQWYRHIKTMRRDRLNYVLLRNSCILIQQKYRSLMLMKRERIYYQKLHKFTVVIQQKNRAKKIGKKQRTDYQQLQQAALIIQQKFRANKAMHEARCNYSVLKRSAIIIQRKFRASKAMKLERHKFLCLLSATVMIQNRLRANQAMKHDHNSFLALKTFTIIVQRRFRANRTMKLVQNDYNNLKTASIIIQQKFRALKAMKTARSEYQNILKATIFLQQKVRANKAMKAETTYYHNLKYATIIIQRRFRAQIAMKAAHGNFQNLKNAAATIQRKFRALKCMKKEQARYQNILKATIFIQRTFKANRAMKIAKYNFKNLKNAVIIIQIRYRAQKMMKLKRVHFLKLKEAALTLQQHYRATRIMKIDRANYQNLKRHSIIIQQRYRATLLMRTERNYYLHLQQATVFVQMKFKVLLLMKKQRNHFDCLRRSTIFIQRIYRANRLMQLEKYKFDCLKTTTIWIQKKYRANKMMQNDYRNYQKLRESVLLIQRRYRATMIMRRERNNALKLKRSKYLIIKIQAYARGYLARKSFKNLLLEYREECRIKRERNNAGTIIKAAWRGYLVRKNSSSKMQQINKNLKHANTLPKNTLANRARKSAEMLSFNKCVSVEDILNVLKDIEFITRRSPEICLDLSEKLAEYMYITLRSTDRSFLDVQACAAATSILINFYKYSLSSHNAWVPNYMNDVITVMGHFCDKEGDLFLYLCTLTWLFAHNDDYKNAILFLPQFGERIKKIRSLCLRKQKMVLAATYQHKSNFIKYNNLPLPSTTPDWGLNLKTPRTFVNAVHAIDSIFIILGIK